jgi:hypothetical protein
MSLSQREAILARMARADTGDEPGQALYTYARGTGNSPWQRLSDEEKVAWAAAERALKRPHEYARPTIRIRIEGWSADNVEKIMDGIFRVGLAHAFPREDVYDWFHVTFEGEPAPDAAP